MGRGEHIDRPPHAFSALGVNGCQVWWAKPLTGAIVTGALRAGGSVRLEAFEFLDRWEKLSSLEIGQAELVPSSCAIYATGPSRRRRCALDMVEGPELGSEDETTTSGGHLPIHSTSIVFRGSFVYPFSPCHISESENR